MINSKELLADLKWRGLIAQTTDEAALMEHLDSGVRSFYIGFDPTAPSLHVGNLVVLLVMRRLQLAGHKPFPLVGGATGLIGDPSGRNEERSLNETATVEEWVNRLGKQLSKFLSFDAGANGAVLVNNLDWTKNVSALSFLRDIGKHFSVNAMLAKDSVSSRLNSGGISYTEFSYQVLQGFDYLELFRRHDVTIQLGGSDQWGNIVAGLDLIRRIEGGSAHVITIPLLTKADGTKFGKTASGAVWLDPEMTSPYAFYQYWLNSDDADMENLLKVFSFKSRAEIETILEDFKLNPGARAAQKALALELTSLVHSEAEALEIEKLSKALFGQEDLSNINEKTLLEAANAIPNIKLNDLQKSIAEIFVESGLVKSKGEVKRFVTGGGISLNNVKIENADLPLQDQDFLQGKVAILRVGKKNLGAAIRN
jgi:tyrosyl-tRNA synthetase